MSVLKQFFTDHEWHRTRVQNFKRCVEDCNQMALISEHEDGFCTELEILIKPSYSLTDELRQMLRTDRVRISDLRVEQSSTTLIIHIF